MTTAWLLSTLGLLAITVGTLLILLYLWNGPRFADDWLPPEGKRAYARHRRLLIISVALLSAWLVIQYIGVILL